MHGSLHHWSNRIAWCAAWSIIGLICFKFDGGGAVTTTGAGSPLTLAGLKLDTNYQCSLVATNSFGSSAPSKPADYSGEVCHLAAAGTSPE